MNTLPETVRVGAVTFRVRQDEEYRHEHEVPDYTAGQCHSFDAEIWIRPTLALDMARVTVLHEVLHAAYLHAFGTMNHPEKYVASLAPTLVQIFQDNPSLIDFLAAR